MEKSELYGEWEEQLHIYKGILFNNRVFDSDFESEFTYDFDRAEYNILDEKYSVSKTAGSGSEFEKAKRLTAHFAPKLTHKSDYDNHIACDALSLLEYSYDNPEHGINCVSKSKILQECCLALGIYARRIWLMPYSPYDCDCHVVYEIFDLYLHKWIMLDPTTNGYFADENKNPLSVLEMRELFANDLPCDFIKLSAECSKDFENSEIERLYTNKYFAKNLFYIVAEKENGVGDKGSHLTFLPRGYDDAANNKMNCAFRLKVIKDAKEHKLIADDTAEKLKSIIEKQIEKHKNERSRSCDINCLIKQPDRNFRVK